MKRFDLWGAACLSLDDVRDLLANRLRREFKLHESGYLGGEYYLAPASPEEVMVVRHLPDDEGYFLESSFEAWPVLIYVSESERWDEIDALLEQMPGIVRLSTKFV